jgi:hypothetical protein
LRDRSRHRLARWWFARLATTARLRSGSGIRRTKFATANLCLDVPLASWHLSGPTATAGIRSNFGIRQIATADVCANETVHVAAPIENSTVDSDVGAASPFGALAVQFAQRTASVF